jgi:hypothetical protein
MRTAILFLILILAAPSLLICQGEGGESSAPAVIPAAAKNELRRLLPELAAIGAQPVGEPKFYSTDLFEYIDGGADVYLDYGLVAVLHQEYKSKGADLTVDIYNMGSAENAFGIYAAESAPDYNFLPIGAEGYGTNEILNFLDGPYYVKLSAFSTTEKTGALLERAAQAVAGRVGPRAPMPGFLTLFPPEKLAAHTARYVKKAPLGHECLAPAVMANYAWGEKPTSLVISKAADAAGAAKKLEAMKGYFASSGSVAAAPGTVPGAMRGRNTLEGDTIFLVSGSYLIVCINPPSDAGAFLHTVAERIAEKGSDF